MSTQVLRETPSQQDPESSDASVPSRWWKAGLLAIVAVAVVASVAAMILGAIPSLDAGPKLTHTITRGDLLVTVTEEGTVESSRNTEIKCEIRGGYGGRGGHSTVTWIIPSGTIVKEGDELVRLDTKIIEETVSLGKTDTNNAEAALARANADLSTAKVGVDAYLKGDYRSQMQRLEGQLKAAKRNLRTAQTAHRNSETLFEQGYVTELEVEGSGFTVRQAELELEVVETQIDVLERLTKAMNLETLTGQVTATKKRVAGREAGLKLEKGRLDLALAEFARCVIRAPRSGLVIYPSTAKWKDTPDVTEGASVHNNQVLLLMPDLTQMQVKVGIHESIIGRVKAGMPVDVTIPDQTLETEVNSVAAVASPAGWWTGNAVTYETTVKLPSVDGLKPGMTAEVEVVVARYDDVLSVPVGAVVETDEGHFCWVETAQGAERRTLELGDSNDKFIVVESGLDEGDKVVLDPTGSIDDARELVAPTLVHTISRGDVPVTLTEQGTLESSDNTKIKCKVRGNSTINWVIESGSIVEAGDVLVELENKQIEEFLHERTKYAFLSEDAAIGFRAEATVAGLAIQEYLEGRFVTEKKRLEKDLAIEESRLRTAQNLLEHTQMLREGGYVSELSVEEREFAVTEAKLDLEVIRNQIDVLINFTKKEELASLEGNWAAAKAAANGHEEVLAMDRERIKLAQDEIERCVIKAERSGLVIYPTNEEWKDAPDIDEGSTVHNDQVLLLMPNLSKMQVKVGIHESMMDTVKPGMPCIVTLPDRTLDGEVVSVASAAQPAGWWTGNMVKYDTIIKLPSVEGLNPGMSAEVQIIMARHEDVLKIPVAAVVETEDGHFCWVGTLDDAQRRSIELGDSSDEFVVVESGLNEGDQVVLHPTAFIAEAAELTSVGDSQP